MILKLENKKNDIHQLFLTFFTNFARYGYTNQQRNAMERKYHHRRC